MRLLPALLLALTAGTASGQEIVADLSQNRVSIDANFDGSEIVVFGAIKPDPNAPEGLSPLEVIVTVSGPLRPVTVRKKDRVAGIWVNTEAVEVDAAPTLYKVAATAPLSEILYDVEDLRHSITIPRAIRSVGAPDDVEDAQRFTDALIRVRQADGLYRTQERAVQLTDQALFRTTIALPANLVEGDYSARIFLTRDRAVVAHFTRTLDVRKVGLERWLYTLAHEQPLAYGVLSLAIAILAGWGASALFRYIRG